MSLRNPIQNESTGMGRRSGYKTKHWKEWEPGVENGSGRRMMCVTRPSRLETPNWFISTMLFSDEMLFVHTTTSLCLRHTCAYMLSFVISLPLRFCFSLRLLLSAPEDDLGCQFQESMRNKTKHASIAFHASNLGFRKDTKCAHKAFETETRLEKTIAFCC